MDESSSEPHHHLGLVVADGSTAYEAVEALQRRALDLARRAHAGWLPAVEQEHNHCRYTVVGLRITGGTSASGQPEWIAYGTLVRLPKP